MSQGPYERSPGSGPGAQSGSALGSSGEAEKAEPNVLVTAEGNVTFAELDAGDYDDPGVSAARSPGESVGRYILVELIGRGGMGVVYSAFDPELDRKVALKLVRPDVGAKATAGRLMREAQAMARLSHPNVITVHDVGTLDEGAVFIAMEFVDGPTLKEWQREEDRTWDEILDAYIKAGRGLAAAHDAELVHRDFKPENVLIDTRGRVRVLDFGLARQSGQSKGAPSSSSSSSLVKVVLGDTDERGRAEETAVGVSSLVPSRFSRGGETNAELTRTGVVLGTPAYMAPEQHVGEHVDSCSDQFAFCVALWEAIYGERPFPGESLTAIAFSVLSGELRKAPEGRGVPERVRVALKRGLSTAAGDRFADMHALLSELEPPEARSSRGPLVLLGLTSVGFAAALGVALADGGQPAPKCVDTDRELRAFWTPESAEKMGAAFAATEVPFASDAWERARAGVETWTRDWSRVRREACEATLIRGEQSESLMELRMACLSHRISEVRSVAGRFSNADARTVEHAAQAVEDLPSIEPCSDTEALLAKVAPPSDPAKAKAVKEIRAQLELAAAARAAGDMKGARKQAEDALHAATLVDYPPIVASAAISVGRLRASSYDFDGAEEALRTAILSAEATGDARMGARAWIEVLGVRGTEQFEMKGAHEAALHAQAYLRRFDEFDPMRAQYFSNSAGVMEWEGKYRDAIAENERALAIIIKNGGEVSLEVSSIYTAIGNEHWELGELDVALRFQEKAYALDLEVLGPAHPLIADSLSNIGIIEDERGDYKKARELYKRSIDIVRDAGQADDGDLGVYNNNIASTYLAEGRWGEASAHYEVALKHWSDAYGLDHPDIAMVLTNLALVDEHEGKLGEALAKFDRAIKIQSSHFGPKHREVAWSIAARADILRLLGRTREAREELRGAIELSIEAVGAKHEDIAQERVHLGRVFMALGQWADAQEQFEMVVENRLQRFAPTHQSILRARGMAAVAQLEGGDVRGARSGLTEIAGALAKLSSEDDAHAMIHFAHARAIIDTDPAGAKVAAERSLSFYIHAPAYFHRERERVEAFLKQLR